MKNKLSLLIIAIALFFTSCEYEVIKPEQITGEISFSQDLAPMFNSRCAGCHGASSSLDFRTDYSYESLTSGGYVNAPGESSELITKINSGHPSSGAFTETEKQMIISWIDNGTPNN